MKPSEGERVELCAEEEGRLVGYASGLCEHFYMYLSDLWVAQPLRGRGLGTRLLAKLEQAAAKRGMRKICLWTAGSRNEAFYEKNGYRPFVVFEDKYGVEGYRQVGFIKNRKFPK